MIVWPLRSLGRGEHWGRTVENRVERLTTDNEMVDQRQSSQGRQVTSSGLTLSDQIERTQDLLDRTEALVRAFPQSFSVPASASGFGIGNSWVTVARVRLPIPNGFDRCEIQAKGAVSSRQPGTPGGADFVWPFPLSSVTSEFGPRPPLPYHRGIDFGQASGTPIYAPHNGTVILKGYYEDWGNYLRLDCSDLVGVPGSWTGYAHLVSPAVVNVGETVTQGQLIGYVGSTGYSSGPHLHYETAPGGDRIDPRQFMDIFGGSSGASYVAAQARIVINDSASPAFNPYSDIGLGPNQLNYPVWGGTFSDFTDGLTVSLQMRTPGGSAPANSANRAALSVRGGFKNA